MKIIAVIPARAGSKGLPRKNRRTIHGKWLVTLALEFAVEFGAFDRIIISTDDAAILDKHHDYAVRRPDHLALDTTRTLDVLVDQFKDEIFSKDDVVVLLEPSAPFRKISDLRHGLKRMREGSYDSIVSLSLVGDFHPIRMKTLTNEGLIVPYHEVEPEGLRRQEQSPVYIRNGSFYISKFSNLFSVPPSLYGKTSLGYICEAPESALNIDTAIDLKLARLMYSEVQRSQK